MGQFLTRWITEGWRGKGDWDNKPEGNLECSLDSQRRGKSRREKGEIRVEKMERRKECVLTGGVKYPEGISEVQPWGLR